LIIPLCSNVRCLDLSLALNAAIIDPDFARICERKRYIHAVRGIHTHPFTTNNVMLAEQLK
jgi:hypothetical protein